MVQALVEEPRHDLAGAGRMAMGIECLSYSRIRRLCVDVDSPFRVPSIRIGGQPL